MNRGWRFCRAIPGRFRGSEGLNYRARNHTCSIGYVDCPFAAWCVALAEIGRRWLMAGTVWAQCGHSSTIALIELDHSAVVPYGALGEHAGCVDFKIEKLRELVDADARSRFG